MAFVFNEKNMTKLWYMYLFVFLENQHNIEQID